MNLGLKEHIKNKKNLKHYGKHITIHTYVHTHTNILLTPEIFIDIRILLSSRINMINNLRAYT